MKYGFKKIPLKNSKNTGRGGGGQGHLNVFKTKEIFFADGFPN